MTRRMLFLSWDGPQVSYVESLFAPIFHGLRQHGIETDILQFSWGDSAKIEAVATRCADLGIGYTSVALSRRFGGLGAMMEAFAGARHFDSVATLLGAIGEMPECKAVVVKGSRFMKMEQVVVALHDDHASGVAPPRGSPPARGGPSLGGACEEVPHAA